MSYENFNICCFKALKHGEMVCPACGKVLFKEKKKSDISTSAKLTFLIPFIALSLNSCNQAQYNEKGIVKDKIEGKVYLSPLEDTTTVFRIIDCTDTTHYSYGATVKNVYYNIKPGDTIAFFNSGNKVEIPVAYRHRVGITGFATTYNVQSINGVRPINLPNVLKKKHLEETAKQAQLQYEHAKRSK